jgi:DNA (cytosine-5)-methyltransferase 1
LEQNDLNADKIFVDISQIQKKAGGYNFVDLFCVAGGMTQGLWQAGYTPVASV